MEIADKKKLILKHLRAGEVFETACKKASITRQTGWRWRKNDKDFEADVQKALAGPTQEQIYSITNKLRNGEKIAKILKEMGLSTKLYARWIHYNAEFQRKCAGAIETSKGLPAPPREISGPHGGYAVLLSEDPLGQRIYQKTVNSLASLERQRNDLDDDDPLTKGTIECLELDAGIESLRDSLAVHDLNQRIILDRQPQAKRYDDPDFKDEKR